MPLQSLPPPSMAPHDVRGARLVAIQDALEGYIDSSRVGRFARRLVQYPAFAGRDVATWLTVPYATFLADAATYVPLASCGPQTYAEWQIALQSLVAGDPPTQGYPYAD